MEGGGASPGLDLYSAAEYNTGEPQLEGSLTAGAGGQPSGPGAEFNTLDEPIKVTIMRDLGAVASKFYHVLYPKEKGSLLKEWDLWGPLILCTLMATILQGHGTEERESSDGGPEFAEVFVIVWVGAMIVTLNTKLLGGSISFFQSVCVLGYCLLPLALSLLLCRLLLLAGSATWLFVGRCLATLAGFLWSTFASMQFLGDCTPAPRRALATYPMLLFYLVIGWMVISHSAE